MWFTGASRSGSGRFCFIISYVEKNTAAKRGRVIYDGDASILLTSWGTTDDDTTDAFVHASEAASLREALFRLQASVDGVQREQSKVHGRSSYTARLH